MSARVELQEALNALRLEVPEAVHADLVAKVEAVFGPNEGEPCTDCAKDGLHRTDHQAIHHADPTLDPSDPGPVTFDTRKK